MRGALDAGVASYPVKDVRVIVYDGKSLASTPGHRFSPPPARKAFVDLPVMRRNRSSLETIVKVEITAPDGAMGDITGDPRPARAGGRHAGNTAGGSVVVNGPVPLSELSGYQARLNTGMTGGRGRCAG